MNQNQNEMTSEQLDEDISYLKKFCASGQRTNQVIEQVESLARQGLQLREQNRLLLLEQFQENQVRANMADTISDMATELEALRMKHGSLVEETLALDRERVELRKDKESLQRELEETRERFRMSQQCIAASEAKVERMKALINTLLDDAS